MFSWFTINAIVFGRAFNRCLAISTQTSEEEQPIPERLYVKTSGLILKRFTSIAAMLGVGAKQLHDTMTIPICGIMCFSIVECRLKCMSCNVCVQCEDYIYICTD